MNRTNSSCNNEDDSILSQNLGRRPGIPLVCYSSFSTIFLFWYEEGLKVPKYVHMCDLVFLLCMCITFSSTGSLAITWKSLKKETIGTQA